jgi:formate dehydrogenase maturation protein FdhE
MTWEAVFCEECQLSFRISHDADNEMYPVQYCPVCASSTLGDDRDYGEDEYDTDPDDIT